MNSSHAGTVALRTLGLLILLNSDAWATSSKRYRRHDHDIRDPDMPAQMVRPQHHGNTKAMWNSLNLTVHIIPHTHNDLGWLKTVDECYYGANNSIQHAAVQYILETVVAALRANPQRKFSYAEQGFFQRWWHEADDLTQSAVRKLVRTGQLSFIGGGWAQHDEGCPYFTTMVDQMTLGHRFLHEQFGYRVKTGWQIDPFGHSSTNARISAQMGYDAQYFARIDYQDRDKRGIVLLQQLLCGTG
eukprot:m.1233287 g.1233287  ORF g.1233287 m.1233287 type:complete len:244 (-) comp24662_c0_seq10:188-919(-)